MWQHKRGCKYSTERNSQIWGGHPSYIPKETVQRWTIRKDSAKYVGKNPTFKDLVEGES